MKINLNDPVLLLFSFIVLLALVMGGTDALSNRAENRALKAELELTRELLQLCLPPESLRER